MPAQYALSLSNSIDCLNDGDNANGGKDGAASSSKSEQGNSGFQEMNKQTKSIVQCTPERMNRKFHFELKQSHTKQPEIRKPAVKQPRKTTVETVYHLSANADFSLRSVNSDEKSAWTYHFERQEIAERCQVLSEYIDFLLSHGKGKELKAKNEIVAVLLVAASDFFSDFSDDFDTVSEDSEASLTAMTKNPVVLAALTLNVIEFKNLLSIAEEWSFDKACLRQWLRAWIAYNSSPSGSTSMQHRVSVLSAAYFLDASVIFSKYAHLVVPYALKGPFSASYDPEFAPPQCVLLAHQYRREQDVRKCIEWVQTFLIDKRPDDQSSGHNCEPRCDEEKIRNVVKGFAIRKDVDGADMPDMELDDLLKLSERFRSYAENVWGLSVHGTEFLGTFECKVMQCHTKLDRLKKLVPKSNHFCLSCVKAFVERKDKPEHVWKDWAVQPLADLCEGWHDVDSFKILFQDDQDDAEAIIRWRKEVHGKRWDKEPRRGPQLPRKFPKTEPFVPNIIKASDAKDAPPVPPENPGISSSRKTDPAKGVSDTDKLLPKIDPEAASKTDVIKKAPGPNTVIKHTLPGLGSDTKEQITTEKIPSNADRDLAVRMKLLAFAAKHPHLCVDPKADTDTTSMPPAGSENSGSQAEIPPKVIAASTSSSYRTTELHKALDRGVFQAPDCQLPPPPQSTFAWEVRDGNLARKGDVNATHAPSANQKSVDETTETSGSVPSRAPTGTIPPAHGEGIIRSLDGFTMVKTTQELSSVTPKPPESSSASSIQARKAHKSPDQEGAVWECPIAKAQAKAAAMKMQAQAEDDEKHDAETGDT